MLVQVPGDLGLELVLPVEALVQSGLAAVLSDHAQVPHLPRARALRGALLHAAQARAPREGQGCGDEEDERDTGHPDAHGLRIAVRRQMRALSSTIPRSIIRAAWTRSRAVAGSTSGRSPS